MRSEAAAGGPRLDGLALFSLLFGVYALVTGLYQLGSHGIAFGFACALIGAGLVQLWQPWRLSATVAIAVLLLDSYILRAPVGSNNQLLAALVAIAVLLAALLSRGADREQVFRRIAMPGRWLLLVLYFYGIFHKINADFLDPQVSCAVELYRRLAWPVGLEDWAVGHWGAIVATFVAEGTAMVLLFSRRWKKVGFLVGVPFHIAIGLSGYAYYLDFCIIVFVCYALFLPQGFFAALNRSLAGRSRLVGAARGLLVLVAIAALLAAFDRETGSFGAPSPYPLMPAFALLAGGLLVAIWRFLPWRQGEPDQPALQFRPVWLALLPLAYVLAGASPYLGFRTEASIAMFSNLHTEAGETNHYLFARPPYLFDYQADVARLLRVGEHRFTPGPWLVRYEIDRVRAHVPGAAAVIERAGQTELIPAAAPNRYLDTPWPLRGLLLFKPVDFARPKPCSH